MQHASLFSGIGAAELAAIWLGWDNAFHCEINPFCRKILNHWFSDSVSYEDVKKTDFKKWHGKIDVLTGGFPCQPFSFAGKRKGAEDDRYLWPEFLRVISEVAPTWVVGENVSGITTMVESSCISAMESQSFIFQEDNAFRGYRQQQTFTIERICEDFENAGYSVQPLLIPACAVGAPHRRDRVFIIGHRNANPSQDPVRSGQLVGQVGEQGSERNERDAGARGGQRLRGETSRTAHTDTDSEMLEGRQHSGAKGHGQSARKWTTATNPYSIRLQDEGNEQSAAGVVGNNTQVIVNSDSTLFSGRNSKTTSQSKEILDYSGVPGKDGIAGGGRWQGFPTVSPVHRRNDGFPFDVDDLAISFNKWRDESIKAYGNAIVPQVMFEIFRAINMVENNNN